MDSSLLSRAPSSLTLNPSTVFVEGTTSGSGLSDIAFLADLVNAIKAEGKQAMINKQQVSNVVKRLVAVSDTLGKLPDPRPTPQLLSVFRSADLLLKCMSRSPVWEHTVREHFLCQDRFTALRQRLQAVWQLHSTAHWEKQDRRAAVEDEVPNVAALLATGRKLTLRDLMGPVSSALRRHPPMRHEDERATKPTPTKTPAAAAKSRELLVGAREEDGEDLLPQPSDVIIPEAALATEFASRRASTSQVQGSRSTVSGDAAPRSIALADPGTAEATVEDIVAFYRRCHLSSWKLRYEDLDRLTAQAVAERRQYERHAARDVVDVYSDDGEGDGGAGRGARPDGRRVAERFAVRKGFLLNGHPVVVKELMDASGDGTGQHPLLTPYTITSFVQDAVVRSRWCHPGLVRCHGAYTERFVTADAEAVLCSAAAQAGLPVLSLCPSTCAGPTDSGTSFANNTSTVFPVGADSESSLADFHRRHSHASFAVAAEELAPVMALGFIMEDVDFSADKLPNREESHCGSTEANGAGEDREGNAARQREGAPDAPDAADARRPFQALSYDHLASLSPPLTSKFVSLQEVLFDADADEDGSQRLSLLDSVDVVTQVGEALQYMLLDRPNVPAEVCTAWLSIAPSNLFLAMVPQATFTPGSRWPPRAEDGRATGGSNPLLGPEAGARSGPVFTEAPLPSREESMYTLAAAGSQTFSVVFTPDGGAGNSTVRARQETQLSFTFAQFPMPYAVVVDETMKSAQHPNTHVRRSGEANEQASTSAPSSVAASARITAVTSYVPIPVRERLLVKYAPPVFIEDGPCSRWRPHPRAASPACYALSQLYLALVTAQPPYRRLRTQEELREKVFVSSPPHPDDANVEHRPGGAAGGTDGAAAGVRVSQMQGYVIPRSLPLALRALLRMGMSCRQLTAEDYRVETYRVPPVSQPAPLSTNEDGCRDSNQAYATAWAYAGSVKDAEEDCAYLLSCLQGSSCNVATNSSATFADSNVTARPGSNSVVVPRVMTVQMFIEGLGVVRELLERRGVGRRERLDLSADPLYNRYSARSRPCAQQQRHADPNSVEVQVNVAAVPSGKWVNSAVLDDYDPSAFMDDRIGRFAGGTGTPPPHFPHPRSVTTNAHDIHRNNSSSTSPPPRPSLSHTYGPSFQTPPAAAKGHAAPTTPPSYRPNLAATTGGMRDTDSYASSPDSPEDHTETLSIPAPAPRAPPPPQSPNTLRAQPRPSDHGGVAAGVLRSANPGAAAAPASGRAVVAPLQYGPPAAAMAAKRLVAFTPSRTGGPAVPVYVTPVGVAAWPAASMSTSVTATASTTPPSRPLSPSLVPSLTPSVAAAAGQPMRYQPSGSTTESSPPSSAALVTAKEMVPHHQIRSEVSVLATPEKQQQQQQQQQPSPARFDWYHPPPSTQQLLPVSLTPSPLRGGGAAALFDTASEAVSTLEQQYRATLKQLDIVQGMYTRLSEHNDVLGHEFNALRTQLGYFRESVKYGLYNEVRRVKDECKSLRQYVELVLCDFAQYLDLMAREVAQGVRDTVAEATGESSLLPYYTPGPVSAKITAASVAAAASGLGMGPRNLYSPEHWLAAISPKGSCSSSSHRPIPAEALDDLGSAEGMKLLLAPPITEGDAVDGQRPPSAAAAPSSKSGGSGSLQFWTEGAEGAPRFSQSPSMPSLASSGNVRNLHGAHESVNDTTNTAAPQVRSDSAVVVTQEPDSRSIEEQLVDTRRLLVLAEGKLRVTEQDCEKRVQRIKEAYGEKEKTLVAELILLRRALGMPTDDLAPLKQPAASNAEGADADKNAAKGTGEVSSVAQQEPPQARPVAAYHESQTLPYHDTLSEPGGHASAGNEGHDAYPQAEGDRTRRRRRDVVDDDGLLVNTFSDTVSDDEGEEDDSLCTGDGGGPEGEERPWFEPSESGSGSAGPLPMRKRYAPLLFDSSDSRAVEKKVRAMITRARYGQRHRDPLRSTRGPFHLDNDVAYDTSGRLLGEDDSWRSCDDDDNDVDDYSYDDKYRRDGGEDEPNDSHPPRAARGALVPNVRQRWQRVIPSRPGRDHGERRSEDRLELAARRLLNQAERKPQKQRANLAASAGALVLAGGRSGKSGKIAPSLLAPTRHMGIVMGNALTSSSGPSATVVLGPGARQLPEQESRDIRRQAEGRLIPSGQLTRPVAPSSVSTVAHGLWAEQVLAQRGLS